MRFLSLLSSRCRIRLWDGRRAGLAVLLAFAGATSLPATYTVHLETVRSGFDGRVNWVHARAAAIPGSPPTMVMTMQQMRLDRSDVFYGLHSLYTRDFARSWTEPVLQPGLDRQETPGGVTVGVSDFTPAWHASSRRVIGFGHTVRYRDDFLLPAAERRRETAYSFYDDVRKTWTGWRTLQLPPEARFENAGAGSVQRWDEPDGTILLPIYSKALQDERYQSLVLRCIVEGDSVKVQAIGEPVGIAAGRGLYEPSLAAFRGRYFLTLRNDTAGYVATSVDGMRFSAPVEWTFDDGSPLGNYNTQQHWVVHDQGLYLVYTRRGADNDHVFRHRAPLFIAQVDPEKLCVLRATERVLVPNRGARLGNFGVTQVSAAESWVTVTEWMQGPPPHQYDPEYVRRCGADNRVWVARLRWE